MPKLFRVAFIICESWAKVGCKEIVVEYKEECRVIMWCLSQKYFKNTFLFPSFVFLFFPSASINCCLAGVGFRRALHYEVELWPVKCNLRVVLDHCVGWMCRVHKVALALYTCCNVPIKNGNR